MPDIEQPEYDPNDPYGQKKRLRRKTGLDNPTADPTLSGTASSWMRTLADIGETEQHDNVAAQTGYLKLPSAKETGAAGEKGARQATPTELPDAGSATSTFRAFTQNASSPTCPFEKRTLAGSPGDTASAVPSEDTSLNRRLRQDTPAPFGESVQPTPSVYISETGAGRQSNPNPPPVQRENTATTPSIKSVSSAPASTPQIPDTTETPPAKDTVIGYSDRVAKADNAESPVASPHPSNQPVNPETDSLQTWLIQAGETASVDNLHAQPDPAGLYRDMGEPLEERINRTAAKLRRLMGEGTRKIAGIQRQQQETEDENHFGNWAGPGIESALQNAELDNLDISYQPLYEAVLTHPGAIRMAQSLWGEEIEPDVNGRTRMDYIGDAFHHEFITEVGKMSVALTALIVQLIADVLDNEPARERSDKVNLLLGSLIEESDAYLQRSMPIEKWFVPGDDAQTVENLTQCYYETIGGQGPYLAAGMATGGQSLLAGTTAGGAKTSLWKATRDFVVNLALANAEIVHQQGKSDWILAVKTAYLTTLAGKTVDAYVNKLKNRKPNVFYDMMGNTIKKRFQEFLRKEMIENVKKPNQPKDSD